MIRKLISLLTLICFVGTSLPVQAQSVLSLPALDQALSLTNSFRPTLFKGLKIYSENPFRMDFLVDNGQSFSEEELQKESTILAQYFLAVLTTPSEDLWVNLSPAEKDRIIPEALGQTIMGRDLLSQDYVLKQLTASLMSPENATGRELWDNIHQAVYEQTGSAEIPEDLLHKIWIVPERALVQEDGTVAYVKEAKMKVMLEEDSFARE